jgi:hypothetical protein
MGRKLKKHLKAAGDPAWRLKKGESRLHNGVLIGYRPDRKKISPLVTSLPDKVHAKLQGPHKKLLKSTGARDAKANLKKMAKTVAGYYTEGQPARVTKDLTKIYTKTVDSSFSVASRVEKGKLAPEKGVEELSSIMTDLAINEAKALSALPADCQARHGKRLNMRALRRRGFKKKLKKACSDFLTGEYYKQGDKAVGGSRSKTKVMATFPGVFSLDVGASYEAKPLHEIEGLFVIDKTVDLHHIPSSDLRVVKREGQEETVCWKARVYTHEHAYGGDAGEFLDDLLGVRHVGVLSGVWEKVRQPVETVFMWHGRPIATKKQTVYKQKFVDWLTGNGCANWVKDYDELHLRAEWTYDTREEAYAAARPGNQVSPHYCSAYSVGVYGVNWVCQQNANCYTWGRWGFTVCNAPEFMSVYIYDFFSNKYPWISRPDDPGSVLDNLADAVPLAGGVPGKWLWYHNHPRFTKPITNPLLFAWAMITQSKMDPSGRYLNRVSLPSGEEVVCDNIEYDEKEVPEFEGLSYVESVVDSVI